MTNIEFSQNEKGLYEATLTGFTGVLQVDRTNICEIYLYASTSGCSEKKLFEEHTYSTLVKVNLAECVSLRIVCEENPSKAQFEAE